MPFRHTLVYEKYMATKCTSLIFRDLRRRRAFHKNANFDANWPRAFANLKFSCENKDCLFWVFCGTFFWKRQKCDTKAAESETAVVNPSIFGLIGVQLRRNRFSEHVLLREQILRLPAILWTSSRAVGNLIRACTRRINRTPLMNFILDYIFDEWSSSQRGI